MLAEQEIDLIERFMFKGEQELSNENKAELQRKLLDSLSNEEIEDYAYKINQFQKTVPNRTENTYWFSLQEVKKLMQNELNRRKIAKLGLSYTNGDPAPMSGAELASMLKSNVRFKSTDGIKCAELKLPEEDMQWWRDAKFGMFIHWGAYSIIGRGEWVMNKEQIPYEEYRKTAMSFNPQHFDANNWAELAKSAGMNYMVMVTRHHDGFALWDSEGSYDNYTTIQADAYRDFVKEYAEAARSKGLKVGVYYSPMDWRFPGYFEPVEKYDNALLMKKQCYDQVGELMSRYGPIDILWYDGSWLAHKGSDAGSAWLWEPVKLNQMAREHNPKVVINERSGWEGDFFCDEGPHDVNGNIIPFAWEKNFSVAGSWAWQPENQAFPFERVMDLILNVFIRDGNVLLNVAPDKDGVVPDDQVELFRKIGEWMRENGESIYGTRGGPFQPVDNVYGATYRENTVYVHILNLDEFGKQTIPALKQSIVSCTLLNGEQVPFSQNDSGITISVPESGGNPIDTIVKLVLDADLEGVLS
ncbi:alpha-L-fucosidase [Paenibacillus sp. N4]|uniref:alpha-L-fucosidase n=1 Tax=Paenibacillus vietnamensis TaxID=2590547 RepID=UPI001CD16D58|nr:alpha-L-fucosidase [Paenibacillus vietnamensis]MCA0757276.1 alpha-L-fucosidase [Paenibacillus vietnamensis]